MLFYLFFPIDLRKRIFLKAFLLKRMKMLQNLLTPYIRQQNMFNRILYFKYMLIKPP